MPILAILAILAILVRALLTRMNAAARMLLLKIAIVGATSVLEPLRSDSSNDSRQNRNESKRIET